MLVVTKFGGSSLSSATQFAKVKNIVLSDPKRKIVVCSALGKRDKDDTKITDLLYILHAHLKYSVPFKDIWDMIYTRFLGVKEELGIDNDKDRDIILLKLNEDTKYLIQKTEKFLNDEVVFDENLYEFEYSQPKEENSECIIV